MIMFYQGVFYLSSWGTGKVRMTPLFLIPAYLQLCKLTGI